MLAHVSEKAKSFGKKISLNMLCYYISGDHLQGVVFVRLQLSCNSPVEVAYYSASHITRQDICCYCAATEDAERDQESLKTHRVVYQSARVVNMLTSQLLKGSQEKNDFEDCLQNYSVLEVLTSLFF